MRAIEKNTQANHNLIRRMAWAFGLTLIIFFAELIGGLVSNSLALLSDAGHLFADVFALGLSLAALFLSRLPASKKRTFGYHRAEVLAAMINGVSLIVIAGLIFVEAYKRLFDPEPVKTAAMLIVAAVGLAANMIIAFSLHHSAEGNLNVRSAYLHVIGDMLASVGVIAGGLIMLFTGNYLADPVISVLVGLIILRGAYGVIKEGANILLEGVPGRINFDELKKDILATSGVVRLHDLHIWTLSTSQVLLTVHIIIDSSESHIGGGILTELKKLLNQKYGISHSTIQFECDCCENPLHSVCVIADSEDNS